MYTEVCKTQGPPQEGYENFYPVKFNQLVAKIDGEGVFNIDTYFIQHVNNLDISLSMHVNPNVFGGKDSYWLLIITTNCFPQKNITNILYRK